MAEPPVTAGGVPLSLVVADALRTARAARGPAPAPRGLDALTGGFPVAELAIEADRQADQSAGHRDTVACIAFGRTFGDRALKQQVLAAGPDAALLRLHAQAELDAARAAGLARFLRALVGHEAALAALFAGGSDV